jgi:hypothetical protein
MIQPSLGQVKEFLDRVVIVGSKGGGHTDRQRVGTLFVCSKDLIVCCVDEKCFCEAGNGFVNVVPYEFTFQRTKNNF